MVRASGSRSAEFNVFYEFDIFESNGSGNLRVDVEGNLENQIGIFPAAIENFQVSIAELNDFFLFDNLNGNNAVSIGLPSFINSEADINNPITLDLTARFISSGSVITDPDGVPLLNAGGVAPDNFSLDALEVSTTTEDRIEYTLTSGVLLNFGINGLTLVIEDEGVIPPLLDTNLNPILDENGDAIRPDETIVDFDDLDTVGAINNIDSIIEQETLGKITGIRVSGPSLENPAVRISRTGIQTVNVETSEPLLIQAEDLNLEDSVYQVESTDVGDVIRLPSSPSSEEGDITGEVTVPIDSPGNYNLTVSTFDENDGASTIEVLVDGERQGDLITLDENPDSVPPNDNGLPNEDIRREFSFGLGEVTAESEILIRGTSNDFEFARIDFIILEEL